MFVDLLAAIPSVVYGLWGFYFLVPIFDKHIEPFLIDTLGEIPVIGRLFQNEAGSGGNIFVAGVILAIMIVPIVTAVTREVVAIVPHELREAAMALGATRYEIDPACRCCRIARSGIVGATMLGLGRALGETIAVAMVIGNSTKLGVSLFRPGYTIPAVIANEFREASSAGIHRSALLALALMLVVISLDPGARCRGWWCAARRGRSSTRATRRRRRSKRPSRRRGSHERPRPRRSPPMPPRSDGQPRAPREEPAVHRSRSTSAACSRCCPLLLHRPVHRAPRLQGAELGLLHEDADVARACRAAASRRRSSGRGSSSASRS